MIKTRLIAYLTLQCFLLTILTPPADALRPTAVVTAKDGSIRSEIYKALTPTPKIQTISQILGISTASPPIPEKDTEGGCGVCGMIAERRVSVQHIVPALEEMNNRGSGDGGGILAMGVFPDYKEEFAFSVVLLGSYRERIKTLKQFLRDHLWGLDIFILEKEAALFREKGNLLPSRKIRLDPSTLLAEIERLESDFPTLTKNSRSQAEAKGREALQRFRTDLEELVKENGKVDVTRLHQLVKATFTDYDFFDESGKIVGIPGTSSKDLEVDPQKVLEALEVFLSSDSHRNDPIKAEAYRTLLKPFLNPVHLNPKTDRPITYLEAGMKEDPGDLYRFFVRVKKESLLRYAQSLLQKKGAWLPYPIRYEGRITLETLEAIDPKSDFLSDPKTADFWREVEDEFIYGISFALNKTSYTDARTTKIDQFAARNNLQAADRNDIVRKFSDTDGIPFLSPQERLSLPLGYVSSNMKNAAIWKAVGYAETIAYYWEIPDANAFIGHHRYPTVNTKHGGSAHPFGWPTFAIAHNGDIANYKGVATDLSQYYIPKVPQRNGDIQHLPLLPLFGTDTEVLGMDYYLGIKLGYPFPHRVESLAPTKGVDWERLEESRSPLVGTFRNIQLKHRHSHPQGPWYLPIGEVVPEENLMRIMGISDIAVLRPSFYAFQRNEVMNVGFMGSEKRAVDLIAQSLYKKNLIPSSVPNWQTMIRGGSVELRDGKVHGGGVVRFELKDGKLTPRDKFGNEFEVEVGKYADLTKPIYRYQPELKRIIGYLEHGTNAPVFYQKVEKELTRWSFDRYRLFVEEIVELSTLNNNEERRFVIELLTLLHDHMKGIDTGGKSRSSLIQITREGLHRVFDNIPLLTPSLPLYKDSDYFRVNWETMESLTKPARPEQVLVIDAEDFPSEGPYSIALFLVEAHDKGWKKFIVYHLKGQRYVGNGLREDTKDVEIDIYDSPGDYLAKGLMGAVMRVHTDAQNEMANLLNNGTVIVHGSIANKGGLYGVGNTMLYGAKRGLVLIDGDFGVRGVINAVGNPKQGSRVKLPKTGKELTPGLWVLATGTGLEQVAQTNMGPNVVLLGLTRDFDGSLIARSSPYPGSRILAGAQAGGVMIFDPFNRFDSKTLRDPASGDIYATFIEERIQGETDDKKRHIWNLLESHLWESLQLLLKEANMQFDLGIEEKGGKLFLTLNGKRREIQRGDFKFLIPWAARVEAYEYLKEKEQKQSLLVSVEDTAKEERPNVPSRIRPDTQAIQKTSPKRFKYTHDPPETSQMRSDLISLLGLKDSDDIDQVLITDPFRRNVTYSRDLTYIPPLFKKFLVKAPHIVVRPRNVEELRTVIRYAYEKKIPVTPRGQGSAYLGGAAPTKGGIVVQTSHLMKIQNIDVATKTVTFGPMAQFDEVERELNEAGLSLMVRPTKATAAIGGFLNVGIPGRGGMGLNANQYGFIGDQVERIKVVDGKGDLLEIAKEDPRMKYFLGTNGRFGIIVEITLKARDKQKSHHPHYLYFDDYEKALSFVDELHKEGFVPLNIEILDRERVATDVIQILQPMMDQGLAKKEEMPDTKRDGLLLEFETEEESWRFKDWLQGFSSIEVATEAATHHMWEHRFLCCNPSEKAQLIANEAVMPLQQVKAYLREVRDTAQRLRLKKLMAVTYVLDKHDALVITMIPTDTRQFIKYHLDSLLAPIFTHRIVEKYEGSPYGYGLLFGGFAYDQRYWKGFGLKEYRNQLKQFNPKNILNPGKLGGMSLLGIPTPLWAFRLGMEMTSLLVILHSFPREIILGLANRTGLSKFLDQRFGLDPTQELYDLPLVRRPFFKNLAKMRQFAEQTAPLLPRFKVKVSGNCMNCGHCNDTWTTKARVEGDEVAMREPMHALCNGCLKCTTRCPVDAIQIETNKYFTGLVTSEFDRMELDHLEQQMRTGKVPTSGAGSGDIFQKEWVGFKRYMFDLSQVARPTREAIQGREMVLIDVELGGVPRFPMKEEVRTVPIKTPLILRVPEGLDDSNMALAFARVAQKQGTLAFVPFSTYLTYFNEFSPFTEHLVLQVRPEDLKHLPKEGAISQALFKRLQQIPVVEISEEAFDTEASEAIQNIFGNPFISVFIRPNGSIEERNKRVLELIHRGVTFFTLGSRFQGGYYDTVDLLPLLQKTLLQEGVRNEITLLATGIKSSPDALIAKALGASASVIDWIPALTYDHESLKMAKLATLREVEGKPFTGEVAWVGTLQRFEEGRLVEEKELDEKGNPLLSRTYRYYFDPEQSEQLTEVKERVTRPHNNIMELFTYDYRKAIDPKLAHVRLSHVVHSWNHELKELLGAFGMHDIEGVVGDVGGLGRLIDLREKEGVIRKVVKDTDLLELSKQHNQNLIALEDWKRILEEAKDRRTGKPLYTKEEIQTILSFVKKETREKGWHFSQLRKMIRKTPRLFEEHLTRLLRDFDDVRVDERWTRKVFRLFWRMAGGEGVEGEEGQTGNDVGPASFDSMYFEKIDGKTMGQHLQELNQRIEAGDRRLIRELDEININPGLLNLRTFERTRKSREYQGKALSLGERLRYQAMFSSDILEQGDISFGAVGTNLLRARMKGAERMRHFVGTGEGGYPEKVRVRDPEDSTKVIREEDVFTDDVKDWIAVQYATGLFGVSEHSLVQVAEKLRRTKTRKVTIKFGQGAKPGLGGHLLGIKVTAEVAEERDVPENIDLFSPFPFHHMYSIEDVKKLVEYLRVINPDLVVVAKIATAVDSDNVALGLVRAGVDAIQLDGTAGGTGAAPDIARNRIALPIEYTVLQVHEALMKEGVRNQVKLIASGGVRTPYDVAKIIALGADQVLMGTGDLAASACNRCGNCETGCQIGITTTNQDLQVQLDESLLTQRIVNYQAQTDLELIKMLHIWGLKDIRELRGRVDLIGEWGWAEYPQRFAGVEEPVAAEDGGKKSDRSETPRWDKDKIASFLRSKEIEALEGAQRPIHEFAPSLLKSEKAVGTVLVSEALLADPSFVERVKEWPKSVSIVLISYSGKWQEMLSRIEEVSKKEQKLSLNMFAAIFTPSVIITPQNKWTDPNFDIQNVKAIVETAEFITESPVVAYAVEEALWEPYYRYLFQRKAMGVRYETPDPKKPNQLSLGGSVLNNLLKYLTLPEEEWVDVLKGLKGVMAVTPSEVRGEIGTYLKAYHATVSGV